MSTPEEVALLDEPTKSPEEILADIEKEKGQLKEKGVSLEPKSVSVVAEPEPEIVDPKVDKSPKPEPASGPEAPTVPFIEDDKAETQDWMKKKGFKNVEAMAESLRNLERELHRRQPTEAEAPRPPAQPAPYAPHYNAPAPLDAIAKQYNMDPDDVTRIGRFTNDLVLSEINRQVRPLMSQIRQLKQDNEKRSTHDRVQRDPTFNDPIVLREMHEIVDKDPSIVKSNPDWMPSVHNEALVNIGRRYLEKGITPEVAPAPTGQGSNLPPPSKGGTGQGRGGSPLKSVSDEMTPEQVAKLPLAEHEKYLRKLGVMPVDE